MTGFTRAARTTDFGWMDALPAIALILALFFGGNWAGEAADAAEVDRAVQGQALSIAMGEANALMDVSYDRLEPTAGFVPMPSRLRSEPATEPGEAAYDVELRVTNLDVAGRLRRVEVRVGYEADDGERAWVETATVRQDWAASHADSQRLRRTGTRSTG